MALERYEYSTGLVWNQLYSQKLYDYSYFISSPELHTPYRFFAFFLSVIKKWWVTIVVQHGDICTSLYELWGPLNLYNQQQWLKSKYSIRKLSFINIKYQ